MILFCLDEFASFGKLQITEALRKLRKRHIRIMVLTQSLADLDMIYGKDERKGMLGNFKLPFCSAARIPKHRNTFLNDRRKTHSVGRRYQPEAAANHQARRPRALGTRPHCYL